MWPCKKKKKKKKSCIGHIIINQDITILAFCLVFSHTRNRNKSQWSLGSALKPDSIFRLFTSVRFVTHSKHRCMKDAGTVTKSHPVSHVLRKNVCLYIGQNTQMIPSVQDKLRRENLSRLNRQATEQNHHFLSYFSHRMKSQTRVDFLQGNLYSMALQI